MKELTIYSFDPNMPEDKKTEIYNELNHFYDDIQKEFDEHLERENEARQAYRLMYEF
jgi:hypothetical protein